MEDESRELVLWIPRLPPSVNALHVHRRGGGVAYTPEAAAFDNAARRYTATRYGAEIQAFCADIPPEALLSARYVFFTHRFFASGWWLPRTASGGLPKKTASPYVAWDGTNRVKVVEDAVVRLTGIDDRRYQQTTNDKYPVETAERAGVLVRIRHRTAGAGLLHLDPPPPRRLLDLVDLGKVSGKPVLCEGAGASIENAMACMRRIYGGLFEGQL